MEGRTCLHEHQLHAESYVHRKCSPHCALELTRRAGSNDGFECIFEVLEFRKLGLRLWMKYVGACVSNP